MALVSDLTKVPLSGYLHIDALLDQGPDWNFTTPFSNTILYTFSVASGNEAGETGQVAFSASQRLHTVEAFRYISQLTGINFVETGDGNAAQVHLANMNITQSAQTSGLCSWQTGYSYVGNTITSYSAEAYIYLDNAEFAQQNGNLTPGGGGFETLLHELGHMLGLKHPFETVNGNTTTLPTWQDRNVNTLMSYDSSYGPYAQFSPYDVAALMWLYGGDGLGGKLGVTSNGRYLVGTIAADNLTGTAYDDTLRGDTGDDVVNGGLGNDTIYFSKARSSYQFSTSGTELIVRDMSVSANEGIDRISNAELFRFADGTFTLSQLVPVDTTAPQAPWISVPIDAAGYVTTNTPNIFGIAEANAVIQVLRGSAVLATTTANSSGSWNVTLGALADGAYALNARATDAAGNVSQPSVTLNFKVDETAPGAPSFTINRDASGLIAGALPVYTGVAEAGATIRVSEGAVLHGSTTVAADGTWTVTGSALANGSHSVTAVATDAAGNASGTGLPLAFRVDTAAGFSGGNGGDTFTAKSGSNVYDGQAGIDTIAYAGPRDTFAVVRSGATVTVADKGYVGGTDTLFNVERLKFADASVALDLDGNGGQAYRIYNAVLDRAPDTAGLGFWMSGMDKGMSLRDVAGHFIQSAEFVDNFGANLSNLQLVQTLYLNILDRPAEQAGVDYWVAALNSGTIGQADALAMISESAENRAKIDPTISNGFLYDPWA
ncbi:MAG TPA: DUF4214 domain-containing protein [Telluria sp.]|nr:DUF4214 domain-containing protein [Telluria sp.]